MHPAYPDRDLALCITRKTITVQKLKSFLYAKVVINGNEMYLLHYYIRVTRYCCMIVLCALPPYVPLLLLPLYRIICHSRSLYQNICQCRKSRKH